MWKQRLDLLEPEERAEMERYVALKVEEMETRVLACDPDDYTLDFMNRGRLKAGINLD